MRFRGQVAIAGYAQSPIVRHSESTLGGLAVETARQAIADAGLEVADIDDVIAGVRLAAANGWQVSVRSGGHSWAAWSVHEDRKSVV